MLRLALVAVVIAYVASRVNVLGRREVALTAEVRQKLMEGIREEIGGRSHQSLVEERDRCLLAILDALERQRGST